MHYIGWVNFILLVLCTWRFLNKTHGLQFRVVKKDEQNIILHQITRMTQNKRRVCMQISRQYPTVPGGHSQIQEVDGRWEDGEDGLQRLTGSWLPAWLTAFSYNAQSLTLMWVTNTGSFSSSTQYLSAGQTLTWSVPFPVLLFLAKIPFILPDPAQMPALLKGFAASPPGTIYHIFLCVLSAFYSYCYRSVYCILFLVLYVF